MYRWYVINTYSGHENKVKQNLEHRILSMNQQHRFRRVVVPTEHLKVQWANAAARMGIAIDPRFSNSDSQTSSDYHGIVVTYAQVASHPTKHRVRTENHKTLVIFDEVHHGGDAKSWGEAIREAYDDATRRLCLTGTPFRSDDSPIPFVNYEPDGSGHQHDAGRGGGLGGVGDAELRVGGLQVLLDGAR